MSQAEWYNLLLKFIDFAVSALAVVGVVWKYNSNRSNVTITDFMKALEHQIKENDKLLMENEKLKLEAKIWKKHHGEATKR